MFPQAAPTEQYNTSAINQQGTSLLGSPPIQNSAMPQQFDPGMLNSTTFAANPGMANMIKALKGGV